MLPIFIIDDDVDIRNYVETILSSIQVPVIPFASATEFLSYYDGETWGCILSDVIMPDMDGMEFQAELIKRNINIPIILMSSHGNIGMVKSALKRGAIDFLEKPIDSKELIDVSKHGLAVAESQYIINEEKLAFKKKIISLTDRENQIFYLLADGKNNSDIAKLQNISIRTVETHRNRILRKMGFSSLQDLMYYVHRYSLLT